MTFQSIFPSQQVSSRAIPCNNSNSRRWFLAAWMLDTLSPNSPCKIIQCHLHTHLSRIIRCHHLCPSHSKCLKCSLHPCLKTLTKTLVCLNSLLLIRVTLQFGHTPHPSFPLLYDLAVYHKHPNKVNSATPQCWRLWFVQSTSWHNSWNYHTQTLRGRLRRALSLQVSRRMVP